MHYSWSTVGKTTVFPHLLCEKRTDEKFRSRQYQGHYSKSGNISPIQQLPVDMIAQFPVADSLHLIDLGVTRRLLYGWVGIEKQGFDSRWTNVVIAEISDVLRKIKLPSEFNRAVRGLDELKHWKGNEYRTFLHYVGVVTLKDFFRT